MYKSLIALILEWPEIDTCIYIYVCMYMYVYMYQFKAIQVSKQSKIYTCIYALIPKCILL